MRSTIVAIILLILLSSIKTIEAQDKSSHFDIEVEPVAYILNGAGITGQYHTGDWHYAIEIFGLEVPESLHGNERFTASVMGAEFHAERYFQESSQGFYIGPEFGVGELEVTHVSSGVTEKHINYSVGIRAGYRWPTGLGALYLNPVAGMSYTLNSKDIDIRNETFETGPLTPFATVGIGWSF